MGETDGSLTSFFAQQAPDTPIIVALSGGVDSSVVATVATRVRGKDRVTAVFFDTPLVAEEDRAQVYRIADEADLTLEVVPFDSFIIEQVRHNRADRCYWCKRSLMSILVDRYPDALICDGTNADDDPQRRPGMRALTECGIVSPLRACDISKEGVRTIARSLGLSNAERASMPCKAVFLPTDVRIDPHALSSLSCQDATAR